MLCIYIVGGCYGLMLWVDVVYGCCAWVLCVDVMHTCCGWRLWVDVVGRCYGYIFCVTLSSTDRIMNTVAIHFFQFYSFVLNIVTCNMAYAHISHTSCVCNSFTLFAIAKYRIRYLTFVVADV